MLVLQSISQHLNVFTRVLCLFEFMLNVPVNIAMDMSGRCLHFMGLLPQTWRQRSDILTENFSGDRLAAKQQAVDKLDAVFADLKTGD